jgi:hypothetical protein
MAQHAKHSLSGSKRRYACPGSVAMELPFPDTSSKASSSGEAMHLVAAWCLTEHRRADSRIGEQIDIGDHEYVEFDDDMAELTQGYVDTVRVLGIDNLMLIEQRVDVSVFTEIGDQFGTADCIILDRRAGELMVIDLKTGYRPVSPVDNTQLMLYGLGALKLLVDGDLLTQRQAARPTTEAQAAQVATAVRPDADHDGQPDAGVVADDAVPAAGTAQAAPEMEAADDLW